MDAEYSERASSLAAASARSLERDWTATTRPAARSGASTLVSGLWRAGRLRAESLWQFAYEDGGGAYFPRPRERADLRLPLSDPVWARKYGIITEVYGFAGTSWEAQVTPRTEAFHCLTERE